MSVQMLIELPQRQAAETVVRAIDAYKTRLHAGIERTQRRLEAFEQAYGVTTSQFLATMAAEDLKGGDLEYVEWAGEAQMLSGLKTELEELDYARVHLS